MKFSFELKWKHIIWLLKPMITSGLFLWYLLIFTFGIGIVQGVYVSVHSHEGIATLQEMVSYGIGFILLNFSGLAFWGFWKLIEIKEENNEKNNKR